MRILVCLPTYNEHVNIRSMITSIHELGYDIVVCDGHSTDGTPDIARQMNVAVLERDGFGKGSAIIKGVHYALENDYDYFVNIDCDQTYEADDIRLLVEEAPDYDMVVGRRPFQSITVLRRLANGLMTWTTNVLYGASVRDMASGLRLMRPELFAPYLDADSFDIEPQMCAVALRGKFRYREVPIRYNKRQGSSKIGLKHLFQAMFRLVYERFRPRPFPRQ